MLINLRSCSECFTRPACMTTCRPPIAGTLATLLDLCEALAPLPQRADELRKACQAALACLQVCCLVMMVPEAAERALLQAEVQLLAELLQRAKAFALPCW